MTRTPVDRRRADVYAAEVAAFEGTTHETVVAVDELRATAELVVGAGWWPRGPVPVRAARADAASSSASTRGDGPVTIRLARPQMTAATLVHELAHVLAGIDAGHGPLFRRAHVDLAGFVLGADEAGWLIGAYADVGLVLGERAWPAPPLRRGAGGPIAL